MNDDSPPRGLPEDGELDRLRGELQQAQAELAATRAALAARQPAGSAVDQRRPPAPPRARRPRLRTAASIAFVVLAALLAPLAVVSTWLHDLTADTERYVETVEPLASDPAVQRAVAARITDRIFEYIDVEAVAGQLVSALDTHTDLPATAVTTLRALERPLADSARAFVGDTVQDAVRSRTFAQAWVAANRIAHRELVRALTGADGAGAVQVRGGAIEVDLAAFLNSVKAGLAARGFTLVEQIPSVPARFTIVQTDRITQAQAVFRLIEGLSVWLPLLALAAFAASVAVALDRRRALITASIWVAAALLLLGVLLTAARELYVARVDAALLPPAAAAGIFDTLTRSLRGSLRIGILAALAIALVALIAGPSPAAQRARANVASLVGAARQGLARLGLRGGPAGAWLAAHRTGARAAVIGLAALAFAAIDRPTPGNLLAILVGAAALALLLELPTGPGERPEQELETVSEAEPEPTAVTGPPPTPEPAPAAEPAATPEPSARDQGPVIRLPKESVDPAHPR